MIVTYRPEGGDRQTWEFNPRRVRSLEAERIEKRYSANWATFVSDVNTGSMRARRVLLWHLLQRDHRAFRWEDTPDFYAEELLVEMSVDELVEARGRIAEAVGLDEETREGALAALDLDIEAANKAGAVAEGKATASSDATG